MSLTDSHHVDAFDFSYLLTWQPRQLLVRYAEVATQLANIHMAIAQCRASEKDIPALKLQRINDEAHRDV